MHTTLKANVGAVLINREVVLPFVEKIELIGNTTVINRVEITCCLIEGFTLPEKIFSIDLIPGIRGGGFEYRGLLNFVCSEVSHITKHHAVALTKYIFTKCQ